MGYTFGMMGLGDLNNNLRIMFHAIGLKGVEGKHGQYGGLRYIPKFFDISFKRWSWILSWVCTGLDLDFYRIGWSESDGVELLRLGHRSHHGFLLALSWIAYSGGISGTVVWGYWNSPVKRPMCQNLSLPANNQQGTEVFWRAMRRSYPGSISSSPHWAFKL